MNNLIIGWEYAWEKRSRLLFPGLFVRKRECQLFFARQRGSCYSPESHEVLN